MGASYMQILVRGATTQQHEFCLMVGLHGSASRTAVKPHRKEKNGAAVKSRHKAKFCTSLAAIIPGAYDYLVFQVISVKPE